MISPWGRTMLAQFTFRALFACGLVLLAVAGCLWIASNQEASVRIASTDLDAGDFPVGKEAVLALLVENRLGRAARVVGLEWC